MLVGQRASLNKVMMVALTVALLFALIGLAVHAMWIVAIIAMAAALSYLYANSRRDRNDVAGRRE